MPIDCIFKKEQAMCLEKIQRVNDLMKRMTPPQVRMVVGRATTSGTSQVSLRTDNVHLSHLQKVGYRS